MCINNPWYQYHPPLYIIIIYHCTSMSSIIIINLSIKMHHNHDINIINHYSSFINQCQPSTWFIAIIIHQSLYIIIILRLYYLSFGTQPPRVTIPAWSVFVISWQQAYQKICVIHLLYIIYHTPLLFSNIHQCHLWLNTSVTHLYAL